MTSSPPAARIEHAISTMVGKPIFWAALVAILFSLPLVRALRRSLPPPLPVIGTLQPFKAKMAAGGDYGRAYDAVDPVDGVRGRAWVASFVDPLDPAAETVATHLQLLQHRARNLGDFYRILTFVPQGADADRVGALAERHHPNPHRWFWLSPEGHATEDALADGLKRSGISPPTGNLIAKPLSEKRLAFLIDRSMRLRGVYDLDNDLGVNALVADLGLLANFDR